METSILITILVCACATAILVLVTWIRSKNSQLNIDTNLYRKQEPELDRIVNDDGLSEGILSKTTANSWPYSTTTIDSSDAKQPAQAAETSAVEAAAPLETQPEISTSGEFEGVQASVASPRLKTPPLSEARPQPLYPQPSETPDEQQLDQDLAHQLLPESEDNNYAEKELFSVLVYARDPEQYLNGAQVKEAMAMIRAQRQQQVLDVGALGMHHLMLKRSEGEVNVICYSLRNATEPGFLSEAILDDEKFCSPGLVFFLSANVAKRALESYEWMLADAALVAEHFGLLLADEEHGNPLSSQQVNATRQFLAEKEWQRRAAAAHQHAAARQQEAEELDSY